MKSDLPYNNYVKNSKLAETLRLLSTEELKMLGKWLSSPWCNPNKKVHQLYLFIRKFYPSFEGKKLSRTDIFERLYPEKEFNDRWLRNLMADFNKQIEAFMVHQRLRNEKDNNRQLMLAKEYMRRNAKDRFSKILNRLSAKIESVEIKSRSDYHLLNEISDLLYYLPFSGIEKYEQQNLLFKADNNLDHYFLLKKWQYNTEFAERSRLLKEQTTNATDISVLTELGKNVHLPAIELYETQIAIINPNLEIDIIAAKNHFDNTIHLLTPKDQKLIYLYLLNSFISLSTKGDPEIYSNLFELYIFGVNNKLNIHSGKLTTQTFINIVGIGVTIRKFEELEEFVTKNLHLLLEQDQIDAHIWASSLTSFHKNEFNKTHDLLLLHKPQSEIFTIRIRFLSLLNYFRLSQKDHSYISYVSDTSASLIRYLRRNKNISNNVKKSFINGTKFITKLSDLSKTKNLREKELLDLQNKIRCEKLVASKLWFLNETNRLIIEKR